MSAPRFPVVCMGFPIPKGWLTAIFPLTGAAVTAFRTYAKTSGAESNGNNGRVNQTVDKDSAKVVHTFDMEDFGSKVAFCRCWRSKKFPYCDGSHSLHNRLTGDNVGPLIIKRRT